MSNYTAEEVKKLSESKGIGLHEAKAQLDRLVLIQQVTDAETVQDLKPILLKLILG